VCFGTDFRRQWRHFERFLMVFGALERSGCSRRDLLSRGSKKISKKGAVPLTFGSLFGPFLGPWGHLASIWEVQDLKKDDLGATRFRVTFLHRNWTHQNVQKSVPVQVSARFSLFHRVSKRVKNGVENGHFLRSKILTILLLGVLGAIWEVIFAVQK
jgi:hypothetical protein